MCKFDNEFSFFVFLTAFVRMFLKGGLKIVILVTYNKSNKGISRDMCPFFIAFIFRYYVAIDTKTTKLVLGWMAFIIIVYQDI